MLIMSTYGKLNKTDHYGRFSKVDLIGPFLGILCELSKQAKYFVLMQNIERVPGLKEAYRSLMCIPLFPCDNM